MTSFYGSSEENPLGTLAGRGTLSQKHKGGKSIIRVNEPCYIMGTVSITPRIDYSQGNFYKLKVRLQNIKQDLQFINSHYIIWMI